MRTVQLLGSGNGWIKHNDSHQDSFLHACTIDEYNMQSCSYHCSRTIALINEYMIIFFSV